VRATDATPQDLYATRWLSDGSIIETGHVITVAYLYRKTTYNYEVILRNEANHWPPRRSIDGPGTAKSLGDCWNVPLAKLKAIPEGLGTVLDTLMLVYRGFPRPEK
jgi:hypothetical protein